jgi:tetratricopeptide (TPR) repeat protein
MSTRLPSRRLFAAALLAAGGLTSAAVAQPPALPADPPVNRVPQTAPATAPVPNGPFRVYTVPLLLEEEQTSEHGDRPRAMVPPAPPAPRVLRGCGLPECDRDDEEMSADEVALRCLLFTINPIAAFLPMHTEVAPAELPPGAYLQHPPEYCPASPPCPVTPSLEMLGRPDEVEELGVMPDEEQSEPHYELLGPWIDSARLFHLHAWPLVEVQVRAQEQHTGSLMFGVGVELSRTGTVSVSAEPKSDPMPVMPTEKKTAGVCCPERTEVQISLLVAQVTEAGMRTLNLDNGTEGKPARWVIEVADEDRTRALQSGLVGLREKGRAKLLSEPRLVTTSGHQASFLSGGEQAVPRLDHSGQVGVQFEEFGTRINCLPVVLPDGTVRLEVEPEISEVCEATSVSAQGTAVAGRSTQRVHTTADVAPGSTLVISGPRQAGGKGCLMVLVTPTVLAPPAPTGLSDPQRRVMVLMNQSENLRQIEAEMERFWMMDQPTRLTPERVHAGTEDAPNTVHELLVKCQRELSRGHYAAAQDLAQQALERDRKQVAADPLVCQSDLLRRVKETASLPLGTVDPCEAKPQGGGSVPPGEAKLIGSRDRMVEALMQEFNAAYKEARYRDAVRLAEQALELDPQNGAAAAALQMAVTQRGLRYVHSVPEEPPGLYSAAVRQQVAELTARSRDHLKQGRYEEARGAALQALSVAPGDPGALVLLQLSAEALAQRPRPQAAGQCTYVGTSLRPMLPPVDPAVVRALQKLLIEGEKVGPVGGTEEAEPKEPERPAPRR